jgi:hypothetical protein
METGVYVLTDDVKNTKSDKRSKHFEHLPVWKKGTVIICRDGMRVPILKCPNKFGSIILYEADKDHWGPLAEKMIPAEENIATLMLHPDCETWIDSNMIVAALLKSEKISIQDIKDTIVTLTAMEEFELEEIDRIHKLDLLPRR